MSSILEWFGCYPQETKNHEKYHKLADAGDETHDALKSWESKFPRNKCEVGGILKTYEYAQQVLNDLVKKHVLSRTNAEEIGCHLWAMAKTSENNTGRDSMFRYFFDNLPEVLGEKNKEVSSLIRVAMIGSGNRKKYAQDGELS